MSIGTVIALCVAAALAIVGIAAAVLGSVKEKEQDDAYEGEEW